LNRIDLDNKVAIVTGGTGGIGAATVRRLRDSGASVVVFDVVDGGTPIVDPDVPVLAVDVTDEHAVTQGFGAVLERFGRLDILVNSAGIAGPQVPVAECELAVWRNVVEVNLTGTFLCCRAAVRTMLHHGSGRIVNVSSAAGKDGNPGSAHYAAAKAAVIGLTKSLGKELAHTAIRVNCVTPGAVDTLLLRNMDPARREAAIAKIPLGRLAEPSEIAAMIAWIASDECSFSTGAVFDLSGGRSSY
jgi:3-oxoacyl-[acyl-carrier protein] reductase